MYCFLAVLLFALSIAPQARGADAGETDPDTVLMQKCEAARASLQNPRKAGSTTQCADAFKALQLAEQALARALGEIQEKKKEELAAATTKEEEDEAKKAALRKRLYVLKQKRLGKRLDPNHLFQSHIKP